MKNMMINKRNIIGVLAMTLILASCNIYKPYKTPEVNTDVYRTDQPADTVNMALRPWQELFTDPALRSLIDSALTNNFDYRTVMLKVTEANAAFSQSRASFFPTLNLSAQENISTIQDMHHTEDYNLSANASWEIDIFGRLRSAKRAAKAAPIPEYRIQTRR